MGFGSSFSYKNKSALGRTRTYYLLIRNQLLYPDELQGRYFGYRLATFFGFILKKIKSLKAPKSK
tara:strand:- start:196 stop:390 length:195 start_codon:yes stop_codon:yes gene_type:complete